MQFRPMFIKYGVDAVLGHFFISRNANDFKQMIGAKLRMAVVANHHWVGKP